MKSVVGREDAPLRRVRQIRGYGALAVGGVLIVSVLWTPLPHSAGITGSVVAGVIWLYAGFQLWLARRTAATARYQSRYVDPNALPLPDRVRYFRRQLILCVVLFPLLSAWIAYELNQLESGAVTAVKLWMPVGFVYEHLGYWPAILMVPTLGTGLGILWLVKFRQLARAQ